MKARVSIGRYVGFRIESQSYQYLTDSKKRESCEIHTIIIERGYMHDEAACIVCCMQCALHELWKHFFRGKLFQKACRSQLRVPIAICGWLLAEASLANF
jgi:hypothetical protein